VGRLKVHVLQLIGENTKNADPGQARTKHGGEGAKNTRRGAKTPNQEGKGEKRIWSRDNPGEREKKQPWYGGLAI